MRTKISRLAFAGLACFVIFSATMSPAQATTVASATFLGVAQIPGGIGYPCTPLGATTVPDCAVDLLTPKTGRTSGFVFSSTVCIGLKFDLAKPKGTAIYGPLCHITASGNLTGYCGFMLGQGQGTIIWFGGVPKTVSFTFKFQTVGDYAILTGTSSKGAVVGSAYIANNPLQGSCFTTSATGLIVTGELTIAELTM